MSYQVLARKWRPQLFREMVGQEHVLKALINALDNNRLHHAYLFTGTRGVGKTTIARILAKCLNCETGVSSEPCGQCSACTEIAEGRFVDLIEVDAASRTKVEDTRELLDNVQYAPTRGRYKIYLIDEVHMLSNHSFNALLKTLEEPPEHVKFLLATTDPQKLPVTILSRCLQFNLKNMSPERIVERLKFILDKELVPFEESGLWALARSADGSMRDALSLTDQAISYGSGKLVEQEVAAMLGTIDRVLVQQLIEALINSDGKKMLSAVADFAEHSPDFQAALGDLLTMLHRIAIAQALPEALDNSYGDRAQILEFASRLAPEDVQLFYQTGLLGRRDLPLSPDPRGGFEMTLLRMLAFKPQGVADVPTQSLPQTQPIQATENPQPQQNAPAAVSDVHHEDVASEKKPLAAQNSRPEPVPQPAVSEPVPEQPTPHIIPEPEQNAPPSAVPPVDEAPQPVEIPQPVPEVVEPRVAVPPPSPNNTQDIRAQLKQQVKDIVGKEGITASAPKPVQQTVAPPEPVKQSIEKVSLEQFDEGYWVQVYDHLDIKGILQSSVANCALVGKQDNQLYFILDDAKGSLFDDSHSKRLADLLTDYFSHPVKVHIELGALPEGVETPASYAERIRAEKRAQALTDLKNDPVVQALQREFGAKLNEETITF
ncbi:DNA polymerase III subunit gamma/tau [Teredinibacter sp. KSP-S5-2]|uniref:DNA polymerase III subunit gamma/tau n=1 Tax=Teredinibacter sp. KSP-S5-2 TaxID=3034506 RepID=UPI002934C534|nr:DNA polymerase III subunit gamma/tau [Teredinibacter sp. KSP-S5-2]WNO11671.1 DNA polymerase III subunit gamma/tau [Teredinibacter sp. KSP-S5-2]